MKFLLTALNAKYIHSNPALYSLKRCAGELEKYVEIAEYTINHRLEQILADIFKLSPEAVGFSCYIWNWNMIQDLCVELHKILPDVPIWLGGPEVSYQPERILTQYPFLRGIMLGEGENTFYELLSYYVRRDRGLCEIAGLALGEGMTEPRALTDINEIPFLYEDLEEFKNRIIYYESSRGCPFRCSYCLSSIDKRVRLRDLGKVEKELQFFLDRLVPQVKFVDRTFNCNHEHAMGVWKYIKEHDNGITNFHFEVAADILNEKEVELLSTLRPGLVQLEIGVQSTNPLTIQEIQRTMDFQKVKNIVERINAGKNIHQHLDLIAGLPYEGLSSFQQSFNHVYGLYPQQLQLGFLKVLKGSPMHERVEEYGIQYMDKPPYEVLTTNWLSYQDILLLKSIEEMVELYYNSGQYAYTIRQLEKEFPTPFAMYQDMADYYEAHGFHMNNPSRAYKYQVLFDFARERVPEKTELYRELLTFDMYLRENMKARPGFAKDLGEYKENIWEFYKEEEQARYYLPEYISYNAKQMKSMTHLEIFYYPVWERADENIDHCKMQKEKAGYKDNGIADHSIKGAKGEAYMVLFDYQKRDPLTGCARIEWRNL